MHASVVVPVYNAEKTIGKCLKSLLNQKIRKSYEIIVVDDGSTDNSEGEIKKAAGRAKTGLVRLVRQANAGPSKARNAGAKSANGNIICFTDSDCEPDGNWLEEMTKPFDNPAVMGVQGAYRTRQREMIARFAQAEIEERYERMERAEKIDWIGSYSAAYRKEVFKDGGFDESFPKASGEDPELSYRVSKQGKEIVFNRNAVVYHQHPAGLIDYLKKKYTHAFFRIKLYSGHKGKMVNDSYTPQTLKLQILFSLLFIGFMAASPLVQEAYYLGLWFGGFFIIAAVPSTVFSFRKGILIGLITLPVLFLRSVAFILGLSCGLVRKVF
jgi:glycosyltransferase involved in cell wall biosynthesis